jgi:formylmethanofuran dehydrogenase subunit B
MLDASRWPLIYLAPELSCEAQREAIALADWTHGAVDTISSATVLGSILAAQERGRATATLGEIRNRADVIVFWGVDPNARYPRYWSRYAPEPSGLHITSGRRGRQVIAVDVGEAKAAADADVRVAVSERDEVALLTMTGALIRKPDTLFGEPLGGLAEPLARQLAGARYAAIVADAEPGQRSEHDSRPRFSDPQRASALIALAHATNTPTRCALSILRAGGNRAGAEAVMTAHTGYPTGVSFSGGFPVYRPHDAATMADAVLVVGDAAQIPADVRARFRSSALAIVGPRASQHAATAAIDTGVAGIHLNGTVLRMDDVPLRLRPSVPRGLDPMEIVRALRERIKR